MNAPSTLRESLARQVLSEVDEFIHPAQAIMAGLQAASQDLSCKVVTLDGASDLFRVAVTKFTSQAKAALTEHIERPAQVVLMHKAELVHRDMAPYAFALFSDAGRLGVVRARRRRKGAEQNKTLRVHYTRLLTYMTLHVQGWDMETGPEDA